MVIRPTIVRPDYFSQANAVLARFYSVLNAERKLFVLEDPGIIRLGANRNRKTA